jgi:hypothetical protein
MNRRIGGAGGGSDKGSSGSSGTILVGAALAITLAYGTGVSTSGDGPTGGDSVTSQDFATRKANGKRAASRGDADDAWRQLGLRGVNRAARRDLECVVNSFGKIREFLVGTPCASLDRALFAVADERGVLIVISVAWVGFHTRADARRFQDLDDTHGTGNISPLGGAALGVADVRFTGQHYRSRPAGTTTVIAEAEPVGGTVEDAVLDGIAEVAVELPHP